MAQTLIAGTVDRFGVFEASFFSRSACSNPYRDLVAEAMFVAPDGKAASPVPLFSDGGSTWKLRFSPNQTGAWKWTVKSADAGLNGQSGSFECVASLRKGGLQSMAGAPRHFQRQNGERVWFMGDTAWALVTDSEPEQHNRAKVERYLKNRAAQGFTAVHIMLLNEAGWGNNGGPPWHDLAAEQINPVYWQEADQRIAFANAQGLTVGLALAWGRKRNTDDEPYAWGRFPSLEARLRYARYIAARYSAYDVYFLVSGEWHGEVRNRKSTEVAIRPEFVAIGDALKAADAHGRMIGIHPMTKGGSTREFNDTAWMSFGDYQQNYTDLHQRVLDSRQFNKPVINSEYAYYLRDQNGDGVVDKPHSTTVDDIRHATWDLVMGGAYVVTGFGSTYMGGNRHPTPFLPDDPKNAPWEKQIGIVKRIFTSLDWWKLEPHDELLACVTPRSAERNRRLEGNDGARSTPQAAATAYWCLANPGKTYVLYARGLTDGLKLQFGPDAAGEYWLRLWNPRTGAMKAVRGKQKLKDMFTWTPPDAQDWVLHLINAGPLGADESAQRPKEDSAKPWSTPALRLSGRISLASDQAGPAERSRLVEGGKFVAGGWQPTDKPDRFIIELVKGFAAGESGAVELVMTGLDFDAQVSGTKQHFFNLYADPSGDQFNLRNAFFTLLGGDCKDKKTGQPGIKVLWRGGGPRGEKAPFGARARWDPAKTRVWRAEWNERELVGFLDGERLFGPAEFGDRDRDRPMNHLFLS